MSDNYYLNFVLSVVLPRDPATDAKDSFVLFLKMGRLPSNKNTIAFERKNGVICGNYVITYPGRTDFIKSERRLLKSKTTLCSWHMSLFSGCFQALGRASRERALPFVFLLCILRCPALWGGENADLAICCANSHPQCRVGGCLWAPCRPHTTLRGLLRVKGWCRQQVHPPKRSHCASHHHCINAIQI